MAEVASADRGAAFPDAHYLVLSSRLVPDLDGGYAIATLARARQMAAAGVDGGLGPWLLTFDPGTAADHDEHRAEFQRRGALADPGRLRNLFDEAADPAGGAARWLRDAVPGGGRDGVPGGGRDRAAPGDAAAPGGGRDGAAPGDGAAADTTAPPEPLGLRTVCDDAGRPVLALPQVPDPEGWHLSEAPVPVYDDAGGEAGSVAGFRGLYLAWLEHVVTDLRRDDPDRPVVVICESRQLGELIADWDDPGVRIVHTVHTIHLEAPYTPDAPLNRLWTRWFALAARFDAVAWPTEAQRADVVARFGSAANDVVVPNGLELPARVPAASVRDPLRVVTMSRLAPGKRIEQAIRAFLAADVRGARLEIWGDGPERERLRALLDGLAVGERVRLRGGTTDPGRVLSAASLFVTSTAYEGQGLSLVEALAHGCPVVSYDVRYGPADALADGGGVLVPDGDERALAEAIRRVLRDDALRHRLAAEAPAAAGRWAAGAAMATFAATVRDVLSRPSRRAA